MLDYNEIRPKKIIIYEDEPYEVLESVISKKSRQQASNQTKLKNIITGSVTSKAFHQKDNVKEADIETAEVKYLYNNRGEWWFCAADDPKNRFSLNDETVGDKGQYIKANDVVEARLFTDTIFDIKLPPKVDLKVTEAPPNIKGNTSAGGDKVVILETGASVTTPLFIETGDIIRVNTETGLYSERVEKG